jgi:hypothetical protein
MPCNSQITNKHKNKRDIKYIINDAYYYMSELYIYYDNSTQYIELYEDFTYDYDDDYNE